MCQRTDELQALAQEESLRLPLPPALIVAIEDQGGMVHLVSGQVFWNGADVPLGLTPTAAAESLVAGLVPTEILPGLELWLYSCENAAEIRAEYLALVAEVERWPAVGEPLTDAEVLDMMDGHALGAWED